VARDAVHLQFERLRGADVNNDFRSRVLMPILLPIGVLVGMAAFIGLIAYSFLYNTKTGALTLAAVVAAGILFTVSLASSRDRLDAPRRGAVVFAAVLPILVGLGLASGIIPGIADEDRMANVEPLLVVPDDAPIIAAENSSDFCLPENGDCPVLDLWEVTPSEQTEAIAFVFDNREAGVQHNVVITDLEGTADDPEPGSTTFAASTLVAGPVEDAFVSPDVNWSDLPEQWYFLCAVHPNMNGVGTVVGAEG
jgi:hypothetical protein